MTKAVSSVWIYGFSFSFCAATLILYSVPASSEQASSTKTENSTKTESSQKTDDSKKLEAGSKSTSSTVSAQPDELALMCHKGVLAFKEKHYSDAENIFKKVIEGLKQDKDSEITLADLYLNLYLTLKAENKTEESNSAKEMDSSLRKKLRLPETKSNVIQEIMPTPEQRHIVDKMFKELNLIIDGHDPLFPPGKITEANPDTFKKVMGTAWGLREAGDPLRAAGGFRFALAVAQKSTRPNDMIVQSLNGLAGAYRVSGRNLASLMLYQAAISEQEKLSKGEDAFLATLLDNSALVFGELGELEQASKNQERALAIYKKVLPANSPDIAQTLSNLAETKAELKQTDEAIKLLNEAITIFKLHLPADHPTVLVSMDNLAAIYSQRGELSKAEPMQRTVIAGLEAHYKGKHPTLAEAYGNIAATLFREKKFKEAEAFQKKAMEMMVEIFGDRHPRSINAMETYYGILMETGKKTEAAEFLKKVPKQD